MISEDRQSHFAHLIVDGIWKEDLVDFTDDGLALRVARQAITNYIKEHDNIDQVVTAKIKSLKRNVLEGTPEWDLMYRKYYEEEMNRRG